MYSDLTVDYLKVTLLNAPAVLLVRSTDGPHLARDLSVLSVAGCVL